MPDLDNHMDDLFRQASENYRPAAGESNWEKISSLISHREVKVLRQHTKSKVVKRATSLLIILFLAATGYIVNYLITDKEADTNSAGPGLAEVKNLPVTVDSSQPEKSAKNDVVTALSIKNNENAIQLTAVEVDGEMQAEKGNSHMGKVSHEAVNNFVAKPLPQKNAFQLTAVEVDGEMPAEKGNSHVGKATHEDVNNAVAKTREGKNNPARLNEAGTPGGNRHQTLTTQLSDRFISMQDTSVVSDDSVIAASEKKVLDTNSTARIITKKNYDKASGQMGFYLGFTAALELSGVKKLQSHPGFDAGIIAGYQINRKLAVEAAVLFGNKFYACDGKYFNPGKLDASMPSGMQILSLNGNSSVLEVPLKLNYNIVRNSNVTLYLSAGFSSYFLLKESNRYKTLLNGNVDDMTGLYKNTILYPVATADVSVAFERKLHGGNKIRLEPYLRLPLKGIGVGDMKVTSAGVRASFILFANR